MGSSTKSKARDFRFSREKNSRNIKKSYQEAKEYLASCVKEKIGPFKKGQIPEFARDQMPYVLGLADALMEAGVRENDAHYALQGALLYEQFGKGDNAYVKKRLLTAARNDASVNPKFAKEFIERNFSEKGKNLEGKTLPITSGLSVLIGVFFLSPNITGNAIGVLNQSSSNFFGGIMFFLGLIGLYLSFKKKK